MLIKSLQIPEFFWCPTHLIRIQGLPSETDVKSETLDFPLEGDPDQFNFPNSSGLHYEADHVFECLNEGSKRTVYKVRLTIIGLVESPLMSLDDSLRIAEVVDTLREQLDIRFPHDEIAK